MFKKIMLSTRTGERLFTIITEMRRKRIKEDKLFKSGFRIYVATHYADHIEVWAHRRQGCLDNHGQSVLIGIVKNGKLKKPQDFYDFDYRIQKNAEKIYRKLGV